MRSLDNGEDAKYWDFILPNVVVESGVDCGGASTKATRIALFNGCVLSWEGTEIRHRKARMADKEAVSARTKCTVPIGAVQQNSTRWLSIWQKPRSQKRPKQSMERTIKTRSEIGEEC